MTSSKFDNSWYLLIYYNQHSNIFSWRSLCLIHFFYWHFGFSVMHVWFLFHAPFSHHTILLNPVLFDNLEDAKLPAAISGFNICLKLPPSAFASISRMFKNSVSANPESALENVTHKILWEIEMETDVPVQARQRDLILIRLKKRTCHQADLAVPESK